MVRSKPQDALTSEEQVDRQWKQENLGFVTDPHRLCVALTRSKYGLIILGEGYINAVQYIVNDYMVYV